MSQIIIEPHYLGSLEYYTLINRHDSLVIEINDRFRKQTFRNRCYLIGSNGVIPLIIPVSYARDSLLKEVTIDHGQSWKKDHWGALYSSYGKAPFFEYFAEGFQHIWDKKHRYLVDLCFDFLVLTIELLRINVNLSYSVSYFDKYESGDFRNIITPKKSYNTRKIYRPHSYSQLFSDTFIPNMSILDLIMCEGPHASRVIAASFLR